MAVGIPSTGDARTDIAIIAAAASVMGAIVTAVFGVGTTIISGRIARHTQERIAELNDRLGRTKADRDALRDYEYEARRRLYRECEPLVFQLLEACDAARRRIETLARVCGSVTGNGTQVPWIERDDNRLSTLYRIAAPAAAFTILRDKLTLFDLALDQRIHFHYQLARLALEVFSHDASLATSGSNPLPYRPEEELLPEGDAPPQVYSRQGIVDADIEALLGVMIDHRGDRPRLLSYPQFLEIARGPDKPEAQAILGVDYLLRDFEPMRRPVLWRLLRVQFVLYTLIAGPDVHTLNQRQITERVQELSLPNLAPGSCSSKFNSDVAESARQFLNPRLDRIYHSVQWRQRRQ